MKLGICGAGGLGREVYELVKQINNAHKEYDEILFIVPPPIPKKSIEGIPIITFEEAVKNYAKDKIKFTIAVGEPEVRKKIYKQIQNSGYGFATLIHPSVYIPNSTKIGQGVTITQFVSISCNVTICDNVYIQPCAVIGHDIVIGKLSTIGAGSALGGNCVVGDCNFLGMKCVIKEKVKIGSNTIISMGAVVYNDIGDNLIALGNPARIMRRNEDKKVFK